MADISDSVPTVSVDSASFVILGLSDLPIFLLFGPGECDTIDAYALKVFPG